MKVKVSELQGPALDWAVAKAIGEYKPVTVPAYSTDWAQGGPLIEQERIYLSPFTNYWEAQGDGAKYHDDTLQTAFTPLIAAMRCYVASKLGEEVEVPEELYK